MRCKILILQVALVMTVGFGVSVARAQIWKVDFQGDENHNSTYGQNGPRDYTEPGVYWNIFEVAGFSAVGATNVSEPPTSLNLLDTEGNDKGVTLTILTDAWGWANEGTLDDLWGDYLIILNAQGATSDPTDWEITGLSPNTLCDLTYYHRANIGGRGLNFVANGVETTVISTSDGYMATASVMTDDSGKITGTANSDGYNEGCWAGLVIAIIPTARNPQPADGALHVETWASLSWTPGAFAASHDVYFGDNFDDVNTGAESAFQGNQGTTTFIVGFLGFPYPDGLVPGTTYYWRVDEVDADGTTIYKGDLWSFTVPPKTAYNPNPADDAKFIDTNVELSWTAGFGAKLHTVYFGDNVDDVNNASGGLQQGSATYTPGPLELDKTYYWRVDEFDAITTHKGDVWSFTTLPVIPISDPNLIRWWKLDEGQSTAAVDWSGHNNHGTLINGPQWVEGYDDGALELDGSDDYVDFGNPSDLPAGRSARSMCGWAKTNSVAGGYRWIAAYGLNATSQAMFIGMNGDDILGGGYGGDDVRKDDFWQVNVWHHICLTYDGNTARLYADGIQVASEAKDWDLVLSRAHLGRQVNDAAEFWDGLVDDVRIYNKALTLEEIKQAMRGDPLLAGIPKPGNGSKPYIRESTPLNWSPGDNASQHDVYFGIDRDAVADADSSDTTGIYRGRQGVTIYTPAEGVEWGGGPYYWRIDEYNTDGTISKGRIWSFTVADFIGIDDFEDYNDYEPDRIFETWIDGWGVETNGSEVGYAEPNFTQGEHHVETTIVHGGSQSMPYFYENNFKYSEATMTLVWPRDWTEEGVGVLSLWFYGDTSNAAERMYVNLNGIATVYHNNPDVALIDTWTEWRIDLQEFAAKGVNLANVNTISIGFGDKDNLQPGGSGLVFFDDIRLYR